MKKQICICAGIVTYHPDIDRLSENVNAVLSQVDEVIIFDNASENISEIISRFKDVCTIIESRTGENVGVASALNEICRYSESLGYEWVLTLDQDSVCPDNIISEYHKYCYNPRVGIISPRIQDRNIGDIDAVSGSEIDEVDFCITSASLMKIQAWKDVGGFWDELFIDMVDFDICWTLKEYGYKILRVNSVKLLHELGHSVKVKFNGNEVAVFNHPPKRYYFITRNTIAVGKKHHRRYQCLRWNLKRMILVIRYESNRMEKCRAMFLGAIDGVCNRFNPPSHL